MAKTKTKTATKTCRYHKRILMPVRMEPSELPDPEFTKLKHPESVATRVLLEAEFKERIVRWKARLASALPEWPRCDVGGEVVFTVFDVPLGGAVHAFCLKCRGAEKLNQDSIFA